MKSLTNLVVVVACLSLAGSLFAQEIELFDLRGVEDEVDDPLPPMPQERVSEDFDSLSEEEDFSFLKEVEEKKSLPVGEEGVLEKQSPVFPEEDMIEIEDEKNAADPRQEMISINFENVDIRDVIRILANKAQVNMIVGPDIQANVNMQLNNVSWERALTVILSTYGLTYKEEEGLVRIMTLEQLQAEEEKIPLETQIITLNFARAGEIKSNFENMLSPRGRIDINSRTNSLIIVDIPDNIKKIRDIAQQLDTRTPQVSIEALIADVKMDHDDHFGIDWEIFWPDKTGRSDPQRQIKQQFGTRNEFFFDFGTTMLTDKDLHATIYAWQQKNRANVLAHPKILTLDNLTATISLTEEIPYQQTTTNDQGTVSGTAFKSSGIDLSVTPHITTKDNFIYLDLNVTQSFRSGTTTDGQPIIDSRSAQTNLLVENGDTAVIGGLRKKNDTFTIDKVPLLGDVPFFGALFRKRQEDISDIDLMIFVTPNVVEKSILTAKEHDRLQLFQEKTENWDNQFNVVRKRQKDKPMRPKESPDRIRQAAQDPDVRVITKEVLSGESIYLRPPELR